MITMIIITFITVQIIDISGFITSVKKGVWKVLKTGPYKNFSMKPFDCSYCMSFWLNLIYMLCTTITLEGIAFALVLSFLTPYIKEGTYIVGDILQSTLTYINNYISR